MLKKFLTILFYDPDLGWVEDELETETLDDKATEVSKEGIKVTS